MQITREKEINVEGKKEKVGVTLDIPMSLYKTKSEVEEEFGGDELDGRTPEQIIDEVFGAISSSLVIYITAALHCGCDSGLALAILQDSILSSGVELAKIIRVRKDAEKMA